MQASFVNSCIKLYQLKVGQLLRMGKVYTNYSAFNHLSTWLLHDDLIVAKLVSNLIQLPTAGALITNSMRNSLDHGWTDPSSSSSFLSLSHSLHGWRNRGFLYEETCCSIYAHLRCSKLIPFASYSGVKRMDHSLSR